jgi:hypothetical protein
VFEPLDDEEVDSQESSIFGGSDSSKEINLEDDIEGVFIANMGAFGLGLTNPSPPPDGNETGSDAEPKGAEPGQGSLVHSPGKVTRMASACASFSTGVSEYHRKDIEGMIHEWIDGNGSHNIPAHLADLARRAHIDINTFTTPQRRGQCDKNQLSTPTAVEGAQGGILAGLRFVLTGIWPYQGSGHGLALGKERVKSRIEKFGGTVTLSFSRLTNALVIGDAPGPKKVIEAHNRSIKIITLVQVHDLILGDLV